MIRDDGMPDANGYRLNTDAPVLEVGDLAEGSRYPRIWVTEPVVDREGNRRGRTYVAVYPPEKWEDDGGWEALEYGAGYYNEGMGYGDAADKEARIQCFQAAEILYLHAAERGNTIALLNLGYVYSYDRCDGRYFRSGGDPDGTGAAGAPGAATYPREERAFECFSRAAESGIAEAAYKLGDMYKHGIGCEADAGRSFECYMRAFELGENEEPIIWGSVALRLGDAYENGFGCEQSFEKALKWYEQAVTGLEIAVNAGDWYYRKALTGARNGVTRCKQELAG